MNSERLNEVYNACIRYVNKYHNFPPYRWLIENTDITTTSIIALYLKKLEDLKLIKRIEVGPTVERKLVGSYYIPPISYIGEE